MYYNLFVPDDLFEGIGNFLLIIVTMIVVSCWIWSANQKNGFLDLANVERNKEQFEKAVMKSLWMAVIYVGSLPFQLMLFMGAVHLTDANPAWKIPSMVMVYFTMLALIVFWVAIPLYYMVIWCGVAGAMTFQSYLRERFPLEYVKSSKLNRWLR